MAKPLEGRAYVITGSGRGIGREIALLAASLGGSVVVNDPGVNLDGTGGDAGPAAEVVKEITAAGGKAVANMDTVSTEAGGENMVKQAVDAFGRLDGVIHVAGILRDRMIFNMAEDEWDAVIAVHLKGTFNLCRHASVLFRQQRGGRFINTSSEAGLGSPGQPNYGAAKEGIIGLTRSLAASMGRYGCTANAVRPRAATRMTMSGEMEAARQAREARGEEASLGGLDIGNLDPSVVGALVAYLASDEAASVNGRDFLVGGDQIGLFTIPSVEARVFSRSGRWTADEVFERFGSTLGTMVKTGS